MTHIIAINIRGLGVEPKYIALKNLFHSLYPNIILIQETMHKRYKAILYFQKMFPSWHISKIDSTGFSGGWWPYGIHPRSQLRHSDVLQAFC